MATAAIAGYTGALYCASTGDTVIKVAEVRNFECSIEQTELDATSHDSSGQREILLGIRSWSGSAEYLFAGNTSSQTQLHTAIANGTKFSFYFYPAGSSATFPIYSGDGYVSGWTLSAPMDDPVVVSFELMGTGALSQTLS